MSGRRWSRRGAAPATDAGRMTLAEHLFELRRRLFRAMLGIVAGMVVAFVFYDPIFNFLKHPYCSLPASNRLGGHSCTLVVTGVFDAFAVQLKVAMIVGVVLSSPLWLYQLWAFVTPGLHRHERRWALVFAGCSGLLFAAGSVVAYYTLGKGLAFLLSFADQLTPLIAVDRYLSFVTTMLLIFGVSFEFPLLVVLLNLAGIVSGRRLAAAWRSIVFGIFVFAALITPSQDPITLLGMAVPMVVLYGIALAVALGHDARVAKRRAQSEYGQLDDDEPSALHLDETSGGDPGVDALR